MTCQNPVDTAVHGYETFVIDCALDCRHINVYLVWLALNEDGKTVHVETCPTRCLRRHNSFGWRGCKKRYAKKSWKRVPGWDEDQ